MDPLDALATTLQELDDAPEDRAALLDALRKLAQGELEEAALGFRRAARSSASPFDAIARVGLGRCEMSRGKMGAAHRAFSQVANDEDAPDAARYFAWMSLSALEVTQGHDERAERALARAQDFT